MKMPVEVLEMGCPEKALLCGETSGALSQVSERGHSEEACPITKSQQPLFKTSTRYFHPTPYFLQPIFHAHTSFLVDHHRNLSDLKLLKGHERKLWGAWQVKVSGEREINKSVEKLSQTLGTNRGSSVL